MGVASTPLSLPVVGGEEFGLDVEDALGQGSRPSKAGVGVQAQHRAGLGIAELIVEVGVARVPVEKGVGQAGGIELRVDPSGAVVEGGRDLRPQARPQLLVELLGLIGVIQGAAG